VRRVPVHALGLPARRLPGTAAVMKPPFTYFGGKTSIAPQIVSLLPAHEHYVEPFAGSLAVLLAKPRSHMETVNDLEHELMNFWRVLRDRSQDLERVCALTPHSRAEHQVSLEPLVDPLDDLERARRIWVRLTQGRGGMLGQRTGWCFNEAKQNGAGRPQYLEAYTARIPPAAQRISRVSLECRPALDVIAAYGKHPSVLIYADPPYLDSTRSHGGHGAVYSREMRTAAEHIELAEALHAARAAVVLSGYHSPLYDDLYSAWDRVELKAFTGNAVAQKERTEVLWSNRPFQLAATLDLEETCTP
jgi:DNA adenine methylase